MNPHLLQADLTPAGYKAIAPPEGKRASSGGERYWRSLPTYLLARCPLCEGTYTAALDTYSLTHWLYASNGKGVFRETYQDVGCSHFVAVQHFINLNGVAPTEVSYLEFRSEVPYVLPIFLPYDMESYAVMHALPICRVEDGRFVPRYSLYVITYYSADPASLNARRLTGAFEDHYMATPTPRYADLPLWRNLPAGVEPPKYRSGYIDTWFDLPAWVKGGKLLWLDANDPALPLRAGPVEAFPYADITGRKSEHSYRDGKLVETLYERRMRGE
jgi:hypothetical protein